MLAKGSTRGRAATDAVTEEIRKTMGMEKLAEFVVPVLVWDRPVPIRKAGMLPISSFDGARLRGTNPVQFLLLQ